MIKKTVQRSEDLFVQFTPEELKELDIKEGDKFSWNITEDGNVVLKKFETIDINLGDFNRDVLEFIIAESCEKDISVNDVISNILEQAVKEYQDEL